MEADGESSPRKRAAKRRKEMVGPLGSGVGRLPPVVVADEDGYSPEDLLIPAHYAKDVQRILIPRGIVQDRIEKLAVDIREIYGDVELHILCVLKGSRGFFAELLRMLNRIHRYTQTHDNIPFMEHYVRVSSADTLEVTAKDGLKPIQYDLSKLKGKHVLVIEDVIESGSTLLKVFADLAKIGPASIRAATLCEKRTGNLHVKADFVGFSMPNVPIVGYCIDRKEMYRDLEHICSLTPDAAERHPRPGTAADAK